MNIRLIFIVCFLASSLLLADDEVDARNKELVDEILEVTGALDTAYTMADYMSDAMTEGMKAANKEWPDRVFDILREEILSVIKSDLENGGLHEIYYPIYDRYFSTEDLEAIVEFYRSAAGNKYATEMPNLVQDTIVASQQWGQQVAVVAMQQVRIRLEEEGIPYPQ